MAALRASRVDLVWNPGPLTRSLVGGFRPAALRVARLARAMAPRGATGQLGRRTRVTFTAHRVDGGTAGAGGILHAPGVRYIYPVVAGQRPHEILPGTRTPGARALRLGEGRFAARVSHPGARPQPYLDQAARSFALFLLAEMRRRVRFLR